MNETVPKTSRIVLNRDGEIFSVIYGPIRNGLSTGPVAFTRLRRTVIRSYSIRWTTSGENGEVPSFVRALVPMAQAGIGAKQATLIRSVIPDILSEQLRGVSDTTSPMPCRSESLGRRHDPSHPQLALFCK